MVLISYTVALPATGKDPVPGVLTTVSSYMCLFRVSGVSRKRREMYCSHARLCVCVCDSVCVCVCLSVHGRIPTLLHRPDVTWGVVGDAP